MPLWKVVNKQLFRQHKCARSVEQLSCAHNNIVSKLCNVVFLGLNQSVFSSSHGQNFWTSGQHFRTSGQNSRTAGQNDRTRGQNFPDRGPKFPVLAVSVKKVVKNTFFGVWTRFWTLNFQDLSGFFRWRVNISKWAKNFHIP